MVKTGLVFGTKWQTDSIKIYLTDNPVSKDAKIQHVHG
jgi:hypothetical protein